MLDFCRRKCAARLSCTREGHLVISRMLLKIRRACHLGFHTRLLVGKNIHIRPVSLAQATREGCAIAGGR